MLILPIEDAREGMKLAAPVMHPECPGQQLLHQGYALEGPVIAKMRAMEIDFIYVDYPELNSLDRHLVPNLSPQRQAIYQQIKQSVKDVQQKARPGVPYMEYKEATRGLIETLLTQGQNPVYMDQMSKQGKDAVAHATGVAHLSLLLGLRLESYLVEQRPKLPARRAKEIINLGVAAMLHDIGLTKLPEPLQSASETEPPEDEHQHNEWKTHAQVGYEMVRASVEATASAAIYQHHQHFDGSGFPHMNRTDGTREPMRENRIHVFSRIIFCANLYDRLSSPNQGKIKRPNLQVHQMFESKYKGWYDPEIFRTLQAVTPPYPPGMRVRLTDGGRAIVMEVPAASPTKPLVRRLAPDGWTLAGEIVDLRMDGAPRIEAPADVRLAA